MGHMLRWSATQAIRRLLRARAFAVAVIVTLSLAIGATATVFSAVEGVLIRSLPYVQANRLVLVWEDLTKSNNNRFSVSLPNFQDIRSRGGVFSDAAAQLGIGMTVRFAGAPELARGAQVSGNYFALLGGVAALGRTISPADTAPGARHVVVLSDATWRSRFQASPAALGRVIDIDGEPFTVIGVMPREFTTPAFFKAAHQRAELWTPLSLPAAWQDRSAAALQVIGRLRAGLDADAARRSLRQLGRQLAAEYPASNTDISFDVVPLTEQIIGGVKPIIEAMFAAVLLLLLVAIANVSNLFLTRAMARRGELAVRRALGASRGALLREALWDSLLLVAVSAMLGLTLAQWGHRLLVSIAPPTTSRLDQIRLDAGVAGFIILIALSLGVVLALASVGRSAAPDLAAALRGGGRRSTASWQTTRARRLVVSAQIALAVVLTVGSGLMVRTLINLDRVDPGFHPDHLVTMRFGMLPTKYPSPASQAEFLRRIEAELTSVPGVQSAAFASRLPLDPAYGMSAIEILAHPRPANEAPSVGARVVSEDYFATLGIQRLSGRSFVAGDDPTAPNVVMVNRAMARQFWPGEEAVGQQIRLVGGGPVPFQVIGVVADVSHDGLTAAPIPELYLPYAQGPASGGALVVRTSVEPSSLIPAIRQAVRRADPDQSLIDVRTMADAVAASIAGQRFAMLTLTAFSMLAVLLSALGLYAVLSHEVAEQRRELAIRAALGARAQQLRALVAQRGLRLTGVGLLAGIPLALLGVRMLTSVLYRVAPLDLLTFGGATLSIVVTSGLAILLPLRRASEANPAQALRGEWWRRDTWS